MKTATFLPALAVLFTAMSLNTIAQENPMPVESPQQSAEASTPTMIAKPATEFSGRLPRFFAAVIDAKQRAAIYDIQRSYYEQKQRLIQQLEDVRQIEMGEIEDVLTAAQRTRLEEIRKASSAKPTSATVTSAKSTSAKTSRRSTAAATKTSAKDDRPDEPTPRK